MKRVCKHTDPQRPLVGRYLVKRLKGVEQEVVHDLVQRNRFGHHPGWAISGQSWHHIALGAFGLQQVQDVAHCVMQFNRPQIGCCVGPLHQIAQTSHHIGSTPCLIRRLRHGVPHGSQIDWLFSQQPLGGLRVGKYRRQRLVQLVRHAARQFTQGVQSRNLPQTKEFFSSFALLALAQERRHATQGQTCQHSPYQ